MMAAVVLFLTFYSSTIMLIKDVCWYTFWTLSVCYICLLMNREGTLNIGCPVAVIASIYKSAQKVTLQVIKANANRDKISFSVFPTQKFGSLIISFTSNLRNYSRRYEYQKSNNYYQNEDSKVPIYYYMP